MSDCDLFVAASDYGVRKARQGFLYDGEVIVEGMPRNDKLVHISSYGDEANKVRKHLEIGNDVKILLYAPTFRDDKGCQQCAIDIAATIENLESNGGKWICLIRSHSLSKGISVEGDASKLCSTTNYLDVTSYPDMADLLLIADLLITDYSSCAGDFILTGKPVVLAHFDRDEYEAQGRPLWVNPNEAGFLVAKNQGELNHILSHLQSYNIQAIADKINRFYGTKETGLSSEAIVRRIVQKLNKN
jgi:CDP-glycerol glycerophosphotransferase